MISRRLGTALASGRPRFTAGWFPE